MEKVEMKYKKIDNGNKRIQILDCTLRDGGLGLEDAEKNGIKTRCFDDQIVNNTINCLKKSKIDIIELGAIELSLESKEKYCIYQDIESISKLIPKENNGNQLYAALYRGPDTPLGQIPDWNPTLCKAVRVIIRYSELEKSLYFCTELSRKGYKVFVQPMLTMRYSEVELDKVIAACNEMKAYALYFVDSYGYMQAEDVKKFVKKFDEKLLPNIKIGFHAHNNMNLAFANVLTFIKEVSDRREMIIDSCLMGMGQGAGNLQTELILGYLKKYMDYDIQYASVLDACEIIEKFCEPNLWGYSVTRLLPAIHGAAYKYAMLFRNKYNMLYKEIDSVLEKMSVELKHRYTEENARHVLKENGYDRRSKKCQ